MNTQARTEAATTLPWIQSPPHVHAGLSTARMLRVTLLAAAIPAAAAVAVHRMAALSILAGAVASCVATEAVCEWVLRRRALGTVLDGSAALTGVLLALTLPPATPVWMAVLGGVAGIALGKYVFGGLGHNVLNPALIGHVFLLGSFSSLLSGGSPDAPALLAAAKAGEAIPDYWPLLWNAGPGPLAATSPLATIAAGTLLVGWGTGRWQAPVGFLLGSALLSAGMGWHPVFHWVAGLAPMAAFFFVNDPVTTPVAPEGRFLFGLGAGALMVLLRLEGSFLEGAAFAVLIMNALAPLLNRMSVVWRRRRWHHDQEARALQAVRSSRWQGEIQSVVVLVLVTVVSGVLLAAFYQATAPLVASQQEKRAIEVGLKGLMPQAADFHRVGELDGATVYEGRTADGELVGLGVFAEGSGYHDTIRLAVGIDPQAGSLLGVRVLEQTETPGLGSLIAEDAFLNQFVGKPLDDPLLPGVDVDAVSGATVSSVAVCDIVAQAIEVAQKLSTEGQ